tara:strand:+ start:225 stop:371 length:147 start_codon:yes stop_codon:yes gene_type:complete
MEWLCRSLATWQVATGHRGHIHEPEEVIRPITKEMHDWFGTHDWVNEK